MHGLLPRIVGRPKRCRCGTAAIVAALAGAPVSAAAVGDAAPVVDLSAQLTLDGVADAAGGVARRGRVLAKAEAVAEFDGTALGAAWLSARADAGAINGRKVSSGVVGDAQGVDNIEGVRGFRIFNAWVAASGAIGGVEAGVIDLNSQFDVHNVAALFVNSSFGVGPSLSHSGLNGPSIYPNSGLGAVGWLDDTAHALRFRLGVFDGVSNDPDRPARTSFRLGHGEGALLIGEVDKTWGRHGRLAVGAWGYSAALPRLRHPERTGRGSRGGFVTLEDTLKAWPSGRRLDGWVRGGIGNPAYNVIGAYAGGGVVLVGPFAGPDADSLGLAVAHADLSRGQDVESGAVPGASVTGAGAETSFELSYQRRLAGWLTVQPDAQYVVSPAGRRDLPDAVVVGVRLILAAG